MKRVFVRNNGMGWFVRHRTVGWNPAKAHSDLNVERVIPWKGDSGTTLIAFLAAEVRRLAPAVEVAADESAAA